MQVAILLRELGHTPGIFDALYYAIEHHAANAEPA